MIRFDAYTATSSAIRPERAQEMLIAHVAIGDKFRHGDGYLGFEKRMALVDESGSQVVAALWGGARTGGRVMLEVKGERTPQYAELIRAEDPAHRCTRVDACADFDEEGAFDKIVAAMEAVKGKHRLWGERRGDWADHPDQGRTFYLGAPSSAVRVRGYEKGKQPEYRHLERFNWARLEVQARPKAEAREEYAAVTAADVFGASKWTRDLAAELLQSYVDPHPCGTRYRLSQRDAALRHMVGQYAPHLASLAQDCGGWDVMGLTLAEMLAEVEGERRRWRAH